MHPVKSNSKFSADIVGPFTENMKSDTVRSAGQYQVLAHLVRPLVRLNKTAQIEGDLSDRWEIQNEFKTYRFHIDQAAKWSDGQPVTADQVAAIFLHGKEVGSTTHFDFRQLESIRTDGEWLVLSLQSPDPNLIPRLVHPETALAKPVMQGDKQDFSITAGAYYVESYSSKKIVMKKNDYSPRPAEGSPDEIVLSNSGSVDEQIAKLKSNAVDFILPLSGMKPAAYHSLMENKHLKEINPHIGYTFWISPNSRSPKFKEKSQRVSFAKVISKIKIDFSNYAPYWAPAKQLFLNDGFGRPTEKELDSAISEISKAQPVVIGKIVILISSSFPFLHELREVLESNGASVEFITYTSIGEFETLLAAGRYDAFQINNDFSSTDVLENLNVTFSDSRPLVSVGADLSHYQKMLNSAKQSQDSDTKHKLVKEIGLSLLRDAYVIPIAYRGNILFANKAWDYQGWSTLYADVRFWKITRAQAAE